MNALRVPVRPLAPNALEEPGRAGAAVPAFAGSAGLFAAELNQAEQRLAYHRPVPAAPDSGLPPAVPPSPESGARPGEPQDAAPRRDERALETQSGAQPTEAQGTRLPESPRDERTGPTSHDAKPARDTEREVRSNAGAERSGAEAAAAENAALAQKERKDAGQRETKLAENESGRRSAQADAADKRSGGAVARTEAPVNERRLTEFSRLAQQLGRAHGVATKLDRPVLDGFQHNLVAAAGAQPGAALRLQDAGVIKDLTRSVENADRPATRERARTPVARGETPANLEGKERVVSETRARNAGTAELVRLELDPEKWRVTGRVDGQAGREFSAAQSLTELGRQMKDRGGKGEQGSGRDEHVRSRLLNDMQTGQTGERARVGAERVFSVRDDAATRENTKLFNELVQKAVVNLRSDGGSTASIRMTPESLGSVTLNLQINRTEVFAQVVVESDAARKLVTDELDRMRTELKAHGINVETVRVSVREPASTGQMESQTNSSDSRQQDAAAGAQNGASGERQRPAPGEAEYGVREGQVVRIAGAEYEASLDGAVVSARSDSRVDVQI